MTFAFIAALIVMVIMTVIAFIALRIITMGLAGKIKDNVVKQLQSYDFLIQRKEAELAAIKEQLDTEQSNYKFGSVLNGSNEQKLPDLYLPSTSEYMNYDFSEDYKKLKKHFLFDKHNINCAIEQLLQSQETEAGALSKDNAVTDKILEKLSFDSMFKLAMLDSNEQQEIVEQLLLEEEKALLEEYIGDNKVFESFKFYDWLKNRQLLNDKQIRVKAAGFQQELNLDGVLVEYDENLCEGFQIRIGNKLYDYGIRKCELV